MAEFNWLAKKQKCSFEVFFTMVFSACLLSPNWARSENHSAVDGGQRNVGGIYVSGRTVASEYYTATHVLLITASHYTNGWDDLNGVEEDRKSLVDFFRSEHHFDLVEVPDPMDRATIETAVADFIATKGNKVNNRVIVYFAGHGATLKGEDAGYIVPGGAPLPLRDPEKFKEQAVPFSFFVQKSREAQAKHVLMVFDSCFSGTLFSQMGQRGDLSIPEDIRVLARQPVRLFFSSGTKDQSVPNKSIFRVKFQEAIGGAADSDGDGYVTGAEIGIFLRKQVGSASKGLQTPQFATLVEANLFGGDIIFNSPLGTTKTFSNEVERKPIQISTKILQAIAPSYFKDNCNHCPELIRIPASAESIDKRSQPLLEKTLYAGRTEVTFAQWDECYSHGGCSRWISPSDGPETLPVAGVTWIEAAEYAQWLSAVTGYSYRLPTVNEWKYLAGAGSRSRFPWGNDLPPDAASCSGCVGIGDQRLMTVGSFKPNRFGLMDVIGNAWEWVNDCGVQFSSELDLVSLLKESHCAEQGVMGGSFATRASAISLDIINHYPVHRSLPNFGFRVVREE